MKQILSFLFCCFTCILMSQSLTKLNLSSNDIIMNDVIGMSLFSNLGISPGSKICGINCTNIKSNQNEIMLLPFSNVSDITRGLFIYPKLGNLYINKVIHTGHDDVFFIGTYNNSGSGNLMVFGLFSLKIKTIKSLKVVSLSSDPNFILKPVDVIYSNNEFYILAESLIDYLAELNGKMVLIKFDGNDILWANIYNSIAPINSEAPSSINMAPNGNLVVSGTIKKASDTEPRMMLAQFDTDGNPVKMKSVELLFPDLKHNNRFGWTNVKSKGVNIHLFSQAVIGASEPGTLLVTMFDNDLNLRTWRNYTAPIRVESVNTDGNFFLFGGQAPVEFGYEGFALMKVNSANAIVEQFKNYKPELKNASIATSSSSVYDRATDRIWTVIKPSSALDNYLILLENPSVLDHRCAENLTSIVAKDTMRLTENPVNTKALQLLLSDIDGSVREIDLTVKEVCNTTASKNSTQDQVSIFPNPVVGSVNGSFTLKSDKSIEKINVYSSFGKALYQNKIEGVQFNVESNLAAGVYFVHIFFKDKSSITKKLVVN